MACRHELCVTATLNVSLCVPILCRYRYRLVTWIVKLAYRAGTTDKTQVPF